MSKYYQKTVNLRLKTTESEYYANLQKRGIKNLI